MTSDHLIQQILGGERWKIRHHRCAPLSEYSSWRIGGPADLLVEPASVPQTRMIIQRLLGQPVPWIVIGKGSNLLFDDAGFRGVVIRIGEQLSTVAVDGSCLVAQAGASMQKVALCAMHAGLRGIEHAVGIPATIGGLAFMNGGSQRRNIGDCVHTVTTVSPHAEVAAIPREQCCFDYRSSLFQQSKCAIVEVSLELVSAEPKTIRQEMLDVLRSRRAKFPLREPNCGSVFSSTTELYERFGPPGKLIEEAGLKGHRVGGAVVSSRHANFIVNTGGAKSRDVLDLIATIREILQQRTGTWLECEVRCVRPDGQITPAHKALV